MDVGRFSETQPKIFATNQSHGSFYLTEVISYMMIKKS